MRMNKSGMSFHWHGRTREGVSKWTGSENALLWVARIFCGYGPVAGVGGLCALIYGSLHSFASPVLPLMAVGLTHGIVFTAIGAWSLAMYRFVKRLRPADEVRSTLGLDAVQLKQLAEQRNIKPRILLNDEPYYDPSDFTDALSLLRASSAVRADTEALLRAVNGPAHAPSDELLRAEREEAPNAHSQIGRTWADHMAARDGTETQPVRLTNGRE